jgi:hypothetical protein
MPTFKQKAAFDRILENPHKPVQAVMREVGYDENTAIHPKDLTESKGFIQLLEEHGLDDLSLAKRHKELLHTDDNIAIKALDMAYKVKAHYAPERSVSLNVNADITPQNEKAMEITNKYEEELLNSIQGES